MVGYTDFPFRVLCRELGATLTMTEMLDAKLLIERPSLQKNKLKNFEKETSPRCIQLIGKTPRLIALAAKHCQDLGADIIDLNFGCSMRKILRKQEGAALLKKPDLMLSIIEAVVQQVSVPVTIKMRTGIETENDELLLTLQMAEKLGIKGITIHGRTARQTYRMPATYDFIKKAKKMVKIPVIANGDIDSVEKMRQVKKDTEADGVMIGRWALGQPWIFTELNNNSFFDKKKIILKHFSSIYDFYGETLGVRIARKHLVVYLKKLGVDIQIIRQCHHIGSAEEQFGLIENIIRRNCDG